MAPMITPLFSPHFHFLPPVFSTAHSLRIAIARSGNDAVCPTFRSKLQSTHVVVCRPCWNQQSRAQPRCHRTDQIADARMWRASISFLAYFLHHRYIVQAHCPPAYLILYLLLCPDLPRSFYPFYLVFNTLIYKFPFSISSTSVCCTRTTTEVSYIFISLPTRANPYIVPFSIGKSNTSSLYLHDD